MLIIRHSRFIIFTIFTQFLFQTCFGQSTCLPLYGTDAAHPNGLLVQLVPKKQYSGARQNQSSTYLAQFGQGLELLWDAAQGPHVVSVKDLMTALNNELSGCIPIPSIPPTQPPHAVPYYYTPFGPASNAFSVGDFNHDGVADAVVAVPGSNQVSVYLGNADGTFQSPVNTSLGNANSKLAALVVADFNGDRKPDVAVVDSANNAVYIAFGKGDGTFVTPLTLPVGHSPSDIVLTDVNNDGNPDLAVTNAADNTVSVLRGNPDGTFIPASTFPVGKNPVSLLAQDLNGDGNIDLIVADSGSSDIAALFGYGNGGFQNAVFTKTPAPPTYLGTGDFNSDGKPDMVAVSESLNTVMMFLGGYQGKLTFTGAFLVPNLSASFSMNDFDGDGNLDLLLADTDSGSPVLLLGRGDGTLVAPPVYPGANGVTSIAVGDFNNDSKLDFIVTGSSTTTSTLSLLTGMGNGQFQNPVAIPFAGRTDFVAVGDFNKDGRLDLAISGAQLTILMGQGNGTFQQGGQYSNITPSVVADFNQDGIPDIAGPFNGGLGVMQGNGDGTFRPAVPIAVGSNPRTAIAADFNNDHRIDLAVLNAGSPSDAGGITVLLGNGTGSFPNAINVAAGLNPKALAVADVNGDGKPDLVVATGVTASTNQISVLLGKGDGTFQPPFNIPLPAGEIPNAVAVLDLDGDGNPDIVVGDCCADAGTSYLKGNGDGTFQPPIYFNGGNGPRAIVVGDWNGDGKPDLAIAYSPAEAPALGAVTVLANHLNFLTAPPAMTNTSAAGFTPGAIAPDSIVAAFGGNLTTGTASPAGDAATLPTTLANTTVTIKDSKGTIQQAPLYFVSPTQINYLVPTATALGRATVAVTAPNGVTTTQVTVASAAPGLFTVNNGGLAAANGVHVQGPYQYGFNVSYTDPTTGNAMPLPIDMGLKTDQVILTLYGTGMRYRNSLDDVNILIGGQYSPAQYAGPQSQYPGLDQLNFQIPPALVGAGKVTIQVRVNGISANPVNVTIR